MAEDKAPSKPKASARSSVPKPPAKPPAAKAQAETRDDDTGIKAASVDGAGATDDELTRRRLERENVATAKPAAPATNGNGAGGGSSASRGEQASLDGTDGDGVGEEADGQMFVWEQGRKVTLGTLIARGTPVEHAFVFGGKRLKGRGQLMGFEEDSLIVGRGLVAKTVVVPTRDDDEKVTKVVIETHLAMKVIVPAASEEAEGMLGHLYTRIPAAKAAV